MRIQKSIFSIQNLNLKSEKSEKSLTLSYFVGKNWHNRENKSRRIEFTTMQGIKSSFFLDHEAILKVGKRTIEEAKGHLVLLSGEADMHLTTAALLDGKTIDFLFGVYSTEVRSAAAKANAVKKFMRNLDTDGQEAIAKFYYVVYKAFIDYHKRIEHPCSCLWSASLKNNMYQDIEDAFVCLQGLITDRNISRDE